MIAPPQSQTVNPGANVILSVTATGSGDLAYQWRKNTQPIDGATAAVHVLADVTEVDEADYDVVITNVVGSLTSSVAHLAVNDPPRITTPPQSLTLVVGAPASFSVTAAGTGPFTYQWRKDTVVIDGAAGPTFSIDAVTPGDAGAYSVVVTNAVSSVTSDAASLVVIGGTPVIQGLTASQLVPINAAVTLGVAAIGQGTLKYQWYKNSVKIPNATAREWALPSVQLKDAGAYRVDVTAATTVSSSLIQLGVVDNTAHEVPLVVGAAAKLEVKAAGNGLAFAWQKNGAPLAADARFDGAGKAILSIKPLAGEDSGLYQLVVSGPGGVLTTLGHALSVFSQAPVITENPPHFPAAIVSGNFSYTIPVEPDPAKRPTAYSATGLPAGLKINAVTGQITGKPTAVSKDPLGFTVKLTASHSKGKATAEGRLIVQALPSNAVGVFSGPIGRDDALNSGLGGTLDLTSTATGAYTGKLTLGATIYALKGVLDADPLGAPPQAVLIIPRKGQTSLSLSFAIDAPNNKISAQLTNGSATAPFTAWRNIWVAKTHPATAYAGYYTFALDIPEAYQGDARVPQGNGYGSFTISTTGVLTLAGKLADGEALAGSAFVGPQGEITVFRTLYATTPKGSITGRLDIVSSGIGGALTWSRPANPAKTQRLYKEGFPVVLDLTPAGGRYNPPAAPQVFLGLTSGVANASLSFLEGGIAAAQVHDLIPVGIGAKSKATLPANAGANPRKPALTLTEKTGLLKGAFTLEDDNPLPIPAVPRVVKRTVAYEGIAVSAGPSIRAYGFFLLPQLPAAGPPATTATTSPILSGQVVLESAAVISTP